MNFTVEKGSRVLVIGYVLSSVLLIFLSSSFGLHFPASLRSANGAGKSTLFRLLAGKHMHERRSVLVMGRSAFFETPKEMAYLGSDWRHSIACVG